MFKKYVEKRLQIEAFQVLNLDDAAKLIDMASSCNADLKVTGLEFTLTLWNDKTGQEWKINRGDYFVAPKFDPDYTEVEQTPWVMTPAEFLKHWVPA